MKVTLRKAAQIVSQIQNWKTENTVSAQAVMSKNNVVDAENFMRTGEQNFKNFMTTTLTLNEISARIKNSVGSVNAQVGITTRVGELNSIEQSIKFLSAYNKSMADPTDIDTAVALFDAVKSETGDSYSTPSVHTSFVTKPVAETMKTQLSKLKKSKNRISDELVAINSTNHIEIDAADYTILESLDIV
jgi:hypothetical protein